MTDIVLRLRSRDAYLSLDEAADEIERLRAERDALRSRLADIEAQNRVMWDVANDREARLAEETAIVDRIWDIYGRPTYEQLAGRSIYDLINADRARLAEADALLREARNGYMTPELRARIDAHLEGKP